MTLGAIVADGHYQRHDIASWTLGYGGSSTTNGRASRPVRERDHPAKPRLQSRRCVALAQFPHELEHNEFARVEKKKGQRSRVGMQLREIMTTDVEVIRPETSVSQAAQKMRSLDVGALPVCEGQRLVGMVTDRNVSIRATAYGHDPNTTPVRHYMSSDLICCFEDQDIKEAEELMRQRRVRRLPILTREKQIAGIVALDDLVSRTVEAG
jgi:CBS domain-containing protein